MPPLQGVLKQIVAIIKNTPKRGEHLVLFKKGDIMKFNIYISDKGFKEKPTVEQTKRMNINRERAIREIKEGNWKARECDINYIVQKLGEGHSINGSVTDTTQLLIFDVDNGVTEKEFSEVLKKYNLIPNVYYRTFSYNAGLGKYKMRAIFILDKERTKEQYKEMYKMFKSIFPFLDPALSNFKQLVHGTNKGIKLIHQEPLNPRAFAKSINYKPTKEKPLKRHYAEPNNKTKDLSLNGIVEHFNIKNLGALDYQEGLNWYLVLRPFNLENLLHLEEKHIMKFEKAFEKGYTPEKGIYTKVWGALEKLYKNI